MGAGHAPISRLTLAYQLENQPLEVLKDASSMISQTIFLHCTSFFLPLVHFLKLRTASLNYF